MCPSMKWKLKEINKASAGKDMEKQALLYIVGGKVKRVLADGNLAVATKRTLFRASLVAQWKRICLLKQETRV